jgi:hypothetical protein
MEQQEVIWPALLKLTNCCRNGYKAAHVAQMGRLVLNPTVINLPPFQQNHETGFFRIFALIQRLSDGVGSLKSSKSSAVGDTTVRIVDGGSACAHRN